MFGKHKPKHDDARPEVPDAQVSPTDPVEPAPLFDELDGAVDDGVEVPEAVELPETGEDVDVPAVLAAAAAAEQRAQAALAKAEAATEALRAEREARQADRAGWNKEQSQLRAALTKAESTGARLTSQLETALRRIDHVADRHCEILFRRDDDPCCAECGDKVPCFTVRSLWQGDSRKTLPAPPAAVKPDEDKPSHVREPKDDGES